MCKHLILKPHNTWLKTVFPKYYGNTEQRIISSVWNTFVVAKAETPILWPPHAKSWLIGKDSDAGRDWGQEEKGMTEDEMAGWHHWLDGRESEWSPGVGDGQGGLACYDSWGCKESEMTKWLNWTETLSGVWLFDAMDCSLPGFSVHGISQARILEWVALPSPGVFLTQGLNLCLLHWQADSLPLSYKGSPDTFGKHLLKLRLKGGWTFNS